MNLPAGIESGFEIYLHNENLRVFINGKRIDYAELPNETRAVFTREIDTNKRVIERLVQMGCTPEQMEAKFVGCRYGSLNETPDLIGIATMPDAPRCEMIGRCPGYGTVCVIPCSLTKQEYQVARFISLGKLDKEICTLLEIAMPTCRTYIERIREKLGLSNRVEIALWAQKLGIV